MIQITKWLNPNEETWYKGTYITVLEWLMIERWNEYVQVKSNRAIRWNT